VYPNALTDETAPDAGRDGNLLELDPANVPVGNKLMVPDRSLPAVRQRERLSLIGRIARKLKRVYRHTARRAKHGLARTVYLLPFLSRHDPRKKVIKCKDHCRLIDRFPQSAELIPEDWYLQLRPRETIQRQSSICLDQGEAARFRAGTTKYQNGDRCEIPEVFLACFHNARLEGRDFLLLSRENQILFESALSQQEVLEQNGILDTLIRPTARRLSGTYALLAHPWAWGYYHWVIEVLPKLSLIEELDDLKSVPLIVPHRLNAFQSDSLLMAGVSVDRMVHLDEGDWQVDHLFFPEMLAPSGNPSPQAVTWLRERFLKESSTQNSPSGRRIYLTRRDAAQRSLLNEEEIVEYLREADFEIICPGELSFPEQVKTFRDVEVVIAPHGAGATNMVFAPPSATLIEFFGDNYINGCYWALANICGQTHAFLTGPSERLDYSIALDDLKALLEKLECFESGDKASKASATPA
jgi:capsular polysaccharide biosynthesis protein